MAFSSRKRCPRRLVVTLVFRCRNLFFSEKRYPRRLVVTLVFSYRIPFGKETNRKRWVDEDVTIALKKKS
jgi:hypothetical protein